MNRFIIHITLLLNSIYSQEILDGYVLFTPFNIPDSTITTYLVDQNFNELNTWIHQDRATPASMPYLNKDSTIWYPSTIENPTMVSGGVGGKIELLNWNNNILWNYAIANDSLQHHHDIEPLPNGNILVIVWQRKTLEEAQNMGRETIESSLGQIWSEAILEIEPIGLDSAAIVWEWHLWDHLIQNIDSSIENYGIISNHPELFNINLGEIGFGDGALGSNNADWVHFNSVHYNQELDQIILSSRTMNEFYVIDHSTTTEEAASHSGGVSGKGGDFLYRWGNPQNYGRGDETNQILNRQHSVNWIDEGYPGEGNIIIFNNFHYGNNSSVIEISPPMDLNGNYTISEDLPYGPSTWEWMFYDNNTLSSIVQSGAFRLENGNTYITNFGNSKMIEVSYDGNILFEYSFPGINSKINRAKKYPENYFQDNTGDINNDNSIDIIDVVILIEFIINENYTILGDLNFDELNDIIDIIILMNQILDR